MPYDGLLSERRIRRLTFHEDQRRKDIETLLSLARRELADSNVEPLSSDGRYEHAYSAVRALAEAVMVAEGFRPSGGPGQHEVLFTFIGQVPAAR